MYEQTRWQVQNQLIHCLFSGHLTLEDLRAGQHDTLILLDTTAHKEPVHLILEVMADKTFALSLFNLQILKNLYQPILTHTSLGWLVAVDPKPNPTLKLLATLLTRSTEIPLYVCTSMNSALEFLYQVDSSLQDESTSTCGET